MLKFQACLLASQQGLAAYKCHNKYRYNIQRNGKQFNIQYNLKTDRFVEAKYLGNNNSLEINSLRE